jgi:hypothetical protein
MKEIVKEGGTKWIEYRTWKGKNGEMSRASLPIRFQTLEE